MSGLHFHALRVSEVRADADDALLLSLEVPPELTDVFAFDAGQYLTLRQGELRRSYSICAAPGEPLRVGVRRLSGGVFSNWLHEHLRVGDLIDVLPPQGKFGAALSRRPRHLLAVAGGSGITPILSLLKATLESDAKARCSLFYGNRGSASTMFKEELEDLKNRYLTRLALHPVFSRETVEAPLNSGRLDAAKMSRLLALVGSVDEAFVCGPHAMNDEVEAALLAAGMAPAHVHVERFGIPPAQDDAHLHDPRAGDPATATVVIVRDGLTREVPFGPGDVSVLAAASRAGLDVPYSCRSGVCATCRAKLIEGQVRMDRNFALDQDEIEAGFVLTCQAHPLTARVVVSFDER